MNEKIKNGGSAFPLMGMDYRNGQQFQAVYQNGMSLRDYFAAIVAKLIAWSLGL